MAEVRPVELRASLHRLSRGLISYGIVGLVVAAIGVSALVWVDGRIDNLRREAETTVVQLATTMKLTSSVLGDASTTAQSFTGTVDEVAQAVSAAAGTMTETQSDLAALEAQLRSVNILGAAPLSSSADAVGRIATSLDGMDSRLSGIAGSLGGNRDALAGDARSLAQLADSAATLATSLRSTAIEDSLADVQLVTTVTLLVFATLSVVPAVGALALGVWAQRELGPDAVARGQAQ